MLSLLPLIGKILISVLAITLLGKFLRRKSNLPKGKIIEGEVVEEDNKEVGLK